MGKGQKLRDQIFEKRSVRAMSFNSTPTAESQHTHLDLGRAIDECLATVDNAPTDGLNSLLPCPTICGWEAYAEAFAYVSHRQRVNYQRRL